MTAKAAPRPMTIPYPVDWVRTRVNSLLPVSAMTTMTLLASATATVGVRRGVEAMRRDGRGLKSGIEHSRRARRKSHASQVLAGCAIPLVISTSLVCLAEQLEKHFRTRR